MKVPVMRIKLQAFPDKYCPYDNAVAEASYKIFKTEFVFVK